jgi:hypothetical protein
VQFGGPFFQIRPIEQIALDFENSEHVVPLPQTTEPPR